jgi:hypothetical protein
MLNVPHQLNLRRDVRVDGGRPLRKLSQPGSDSTSRKDDGAAGAEVICELGERLVDSRAHPLEIGIFEKAVGPHGWLPLRWDSHGVCLAAACRRLSAKTIPGHVVAEREQRITRV